MPFVPFGEWLPDQPDFNNPGATTITNVYPRTEGSYGPVGGLSTILTALTNRCQGAIGIRDSLGNGYVFAGDSTKLYVASGASSSFGDVSKVGGYTISADEAWRGSQFNDTVLMHNISDPIQSYVLNSSTIFADLAAAAPKCRYSCIARNFLIVGNTSGGTADGSGPGLKPQRIWWPAIGDPTNWPTLGTSSAAAVQSDAQDVVGDHGWLTGLVANVGPVDALAFFERAVFRLMYIGSPDIWGFYPARGVRGCFAPHSIALTEAGVIYYAQDDFYLFDGANAVGIGHGKIAKTLIADLSVTFASRMVAAVDPINKLYWVAYPSSQSTGNPDTLLVCNYAQKSLTGTPGRWAKVTGLTVEWLLVAPSFGYNIDTLDNTGYNIDTLPLSLDSRVWTGGSVNNLAAFDSTNAVALFNGTNLAPTVETSESQIIKGRRAFVSMTRPIVDGGTPSVTPITRNRIEDSITVGTTSAMNADGYCPVRAEGFYHRFRVTLAANSTFNHMQGVEIPDDAITDSGAR